jgi:hypothetical protein
MSNGDEAAVPVVKADRRYGGVTIDHLYRAHSGGMYLYHPVHRPPELEHDESSPETVNLTAKQARSLRDQLNRMDLGDNDEKGK